MSAADLERFGAPVDFKPSQVRMWRGVLPLIDTFGHAETEFAAALMVLACGKQGDQWQPVSLPQMGEAMKKEGEPGGVLAHLRTNPFTPSPDFRRLASDGFAVFLGDPDDVPAPPIRFTDKGLDILRRTVAKVAP